MQTINLAFVGSGNWAQRYHFPALAYIQSQNAAQYSINLRGITSLDLDAAHMVADKFAFEQVYSDTDALLADPNVDALAIAVSPEAAKSVISHIVDRQLPIFSEKPPGVSSIEAQTLSDIVTVPNVLAFNRRFNPLNKIFYKIIS